MPQIREIVPGDLDLDSPLGLRQNRQRWNAVLLAW
jgi:hypothetical protein